MTRRANIDPVKRAAIWEAHDRRCVYTADKIDVAVLAIDHLIPIEGGDAVLAGLQAKGLVAAVFNLNGFENLVPTHGPRNRQKSDLELDEGPLVFFLQLAAKKAARAKVLYDEMMERDAEVALGRVGSILATLAMSHFTETRANAPPALLEQIRKERGDVDRVLGAHLLNAPIEDLSKLERLPDMLERMDLLGSAFALTYALGDIEAAKTGNYVPQDISAQELEDSITKWRTHPDLSNVADQPVLAITGRSLFRSVVLGARLQFNVPDNEDAFGVVESILAAYEAFLATSQESDLVPRAEAMLIEVVIEDSKGHRFQLEFDDEDSGTRGTLTIPHYMEFHSKEELGAFIRDVRDAVVDITCRIFHVSDVERWLDRLGEKENAFDRALIMANMVVLDRNVYGHPTGAMLASWLPADGPRVPFTRSGPLPGGEKAKKKLGPFAEKLVQKSPSDEAFDPEKLSHKDRQVLSPINDMRWNRAQWRGTLFVVDTRPGAPPVLGVGFTNDEMGWKIFEELQARFGSYDETNDLRVAIIRGIDADNPLAYAVTIGPNLDNVDLREGKIVTGFTRINRMYPQSLVNLNRFLAKYHQEGGYLLAPAKMNPDDLNDAGFSPKLGIAKRHLVVRDAWMLDEYDWDLMAIHEDDTPYVPEGNDATRVLRGLARRKEANSKRRGGG